jgi:hypothetical protein
MGYLTTNKIAMEEILFAHGMPLAKWIAPLLADGNVTLKGLCY